MAKDTAVEKQIKYRTARQNRPLRSFRKGCGASAKQGGVETQRGVQSQRWGQIAKTAPKTQRVGWKRKAVRWGKNAKGRAETRPRAIKYYTLSFKPGELKG